MTAMREQAQAFDSPGSEEAPPEVSAQEHKPPAKQNRGKQEPLLVELAWLIIEGAIAFRRLRGILARL
jgi:hypothetical protein